LELIELKDLHELCQFEGAKNVRAMLVPWDEDGFVLMFKSRSTSYLLRTKSGPLPRVFKSADTALGICRTSGFTSVTVNFLARPIEYEKPKWVREQK
jgi:hypothetical protein